MLNDHVGGGGCQTGVLCSLVAHVDGLPFVVVTALVYVSMATLTVCIWSVTALICASTPLLLGTMGGHNIVGANMGVTARSARSFNLRTQRFSCLRSRCGMISLGAEAGSSDSTVVNTMGARLMEIFGEQECADARTGHKSRCRHACCSTCKDN